MREKTKDHTCVKDPITVADYCFNSKGWSEKGLRISCLQWNMNGKKGPNSLDELAFMRTIEQKLIILESDLVFITTQECSQTIFKSFCCNKMKHWRELLFEFFSFTHFPLIDDRLNALGTILFIRHTLTKKSKGQIISQLPSQVFSWRERTSPQQSFCFGQSGDSGEWNAGVWELSFTLGTG